MFLWWKTGKNYDGCAVLLRDVLQLCVSLHSSHRISISNNKRLKWTMDMVVGWFSFLVSSPRITIKDSCFFLGFFLKHIFFLLSSGNASLLWIMMVKLLSSCFYLFCADFYRWEEQERIHNFLAFPLTQNIALQNATVWILILFCFQIIKKCFTV